MKTLFLSFFILVLIVKTESSFAFTNTLKTFATDGCTLFIDGPPKAPGLWRHCCVEHDMRYWFGGDISDRDQADLRLRGCIKEVAGNTWAELIYNGVRIGHASPIKDKTHWSWGWMKARANTRLTLDESEYVIGELRRLPFDTLVIEKFIERNF